MKETNKPNELFLQNIENQFSKFEQFCPVFNIIQELLSKSKLKLSLSGIQIYQNEIYEKNFF